MSKFTFFFQNISEKLKKLPNPFRSSKKKFYFDPDTLSYEEIQISITQWLKRLFSHIITGLLFGIAFFFIFITLFKSPGEMQAFTEKNQMEGQYKALLRQMNEMQGVLTDLQQRDDNLYRVIFQADPIPYDIRNNSSNKAEYYKELLNMTNSEIAVSTTKKMDQIKKELYIQSKSYDDLVNMAKNKEQMLEHLPSIQPVANKDLTRIASGFGYRIDPIYHTRRFHAGMDFTAPIGTDVYATANGTISFAGWEQGYGNCIKIDHGYGYETLYGHLSAIEVHIGEAVKRGAVIGLVGSTGKSTGPHLHYEVHYKGEIMNPSNYYFMDLTPDEYDKMIQISNNAGQMFD